VRVDLVEQTGTFTKRHPWEVARAEFFLRLLSRRGLLDTGTNWLDVGAGDAWFAGQLRRLLSPAASLTCWDINYSHEDIATRGEEGMTLVADRPTDRFDRVIMLDVIEHVDEDVDFLHGIVNDLLAEDAVVLVSVPAYPALFSSHDRTLRHCRRYSPGECRRLLEGSGLSVIAEGGLFHSLLPLRVGQVLLERARAPKSPSEGIGNWQAGATTTRAITRALITDGKLSLALSQRGLSLPGLSYWALCSTKSPASPAGEAV
jgi:SAM-dependent methyltransferase